MQGYKISQSFPQLLPKSDGADVSAAVVKVNEQMGVLAVCLRSTPAEVKSIYLVDAKSGDITAKLKRHTKKVNCFIYRAE